jgi:hypothetical protein
MRERFVVEKMTKETGGSAFPLLPPIDSDDRSPQGYPFPDAGMTLRQWYAGQALAGLSAGVNNWRPGDGDFAALAFRHADAMIAEGSK